MTSQATELLTIQAIAKRAVALGHEHGVNHDLHGVMMDVHSVHMSVPLDLDRLLEADDFNFAHDVFGISKYLDRKTGELTDCFRPRHAVMS